jgi:hypothetical protein
MHLFSRDGHVPWPVAHPTIVEFDLPATVGAGDSRELSASKQLAPKLHHHVFTLTRKVCDACMQRSNGWSDCRVHARSGGRVDGMKGNGWSDCLDCRVHARSGGRVDGMKEGDVPSFGAASTAQARRGHEHAPRGRGSVVDMCTSGEWAAASGVIVFPFSVYSVQPSKSDSKHTRDAIGKRAFECACSSPCGRVRVNTCPLHWPL